MGYCSSYTGEIFFDRPIPIGYVRDHMPNPYESWWCEFIWLITKETEETFNGVVTTEQVYGIGRGADGQFKAYSSSEKRLRIMLDVLPASVKFTGAFDYVGEDGEQWRIGINSKREVQRVNGRVVFPEFD